MGNKKKKGDDPGGNKDQQQQNPRPPQQQQQQNPRPQQQQQQQQLKSTSQTSDGPQQQGRRQDDGQKSFDKKRADGWKCMNCNKNNFAQNIECYTCKGPKPTTSQIQSSGTGESSGQAAQQPTMQAVATQQQSSGAIPKQKPPQQQQPSEGKNKSDWKCCGKTHFAKKQICNICQKPRPAAVEQPKLQPLSSSSSSASSSIPAADSDMKRLSEGNLKISPVKHSKHGKTFIIESSKTPSQYEGKAGRKCNLEVNYGKISFDPKKLPKEAHHYDVTFDPESPKKFLPYALDEFMKKLFRGIIYGFDGRKNMYTPLKLQQNGQVVDGEGIIHEVTAVMGDRQKNFKVKVKYAGSKDLAILLNYNNAANYQAEKPSEAIQVLDVLLRSVFKNIRGTIQAGRNLYFSPKQKMDLGEGMELFYGLFQSAILGRASVYLNVDVLHKAFPSNMALLDYISVNMTRDGRVPNELQRWQFEKLNDHLRMLTIGYRLNPNDAPQTYGFNDLIPANNATFTNEQGQKMTVADYFRTVKRKQLKYPNLPYLWVGSRNKRVYLPMEFCEIPAGQATNKKCSSNCVAKIIRYSATTTDDRKAKIKGLLDQINYATDPTITGFGIQVDKNFQNVNGRVIDPPKLKYKNGIVTPSRGAWNGKVFLNTEPAPIKWCIINCDERTQTPAIIKLKNDLMTGARSQNLTLMDMQAQEIKTVKPSYNIKSDIEKVLANCLQQGYRLVLVILTDKDNCYARVKQAAELRVGILTQCIRADTIFRMGRGNPMMTINNIILKINSKLNGTNQEISETYYNNFNTRASGVMFIGADVTHPPPENKNQPSVVGVASSYDDIGFRYCCAWRLQDPKKEMIEDLEEILVGHLKFYYDKNKTLPGKILYYRDGVSDGQFSEVLAREMTAIENAMKRIFGAKSPAAVTFIVVQKRHHTRFFPTQKEFTDGKFNNIVAGTVVDKDIIHPFQYQFFMASHAAIQGVTKPTKYCILINQSNIAPDCIQAITYDLCHYFTRCNRSVSYPAPTYYAHLVAERGKNYIVGDQHTLNMGNLRREYEMRAIKPAIVNNAPMFFV